MVPSDTFSNVITSRRMVVLPEPLGPISVTNSPGATVKFRSSRTVFEPKRLTTFSNRIISLLVSDGSDTTLQPSNQNCTGITEGQERQARSRPRFGTCATLTRRVLGLHLVDDVEYRDGRQQRHFLEHGNRVIAQRRKHPRHGLRQDHPGPDSPPRQTQRGGGFPLASRHRLDACPVDLG